MKKLLKLIRSNLLFHELMHGIFAVPVATYFWLKTGSLLQVLLVFAVTYLVDADHLFDYFCYYGLSFKISNFFHGDYFSEKKVAYVPLHAWEWLLILGAVIVFTAQKLGSFYTIVFLSLLPHYILDSISLKSIKFYSIVYRYFQWKKQ